MFTIIVAAAHSAAQPFSRRHALCIGGTLTLLPERAPAVTGTTGRVLQDNALVSGSGFSLRLPSGYFAQRGGTGDALFVAGNYVAGRTVSVTRTAAYDLLADSGDPLPFTSGVPTTLRDLGKPTYIATLLTSRRDGDPRGLAVARNELLATSREENELRFTLVAQTSAEVSMTTAKPAARIVQVRTIFVPAEFPSYTELGRADVPMSPRGRGPYLLTIWASSPAQTLAGCETPACDCGEGSPLQCNCAPSNCRVADGNEPDAVDLAIVNSLDLA
uniref:Uncharacterized protein n=2 Tax=Calcidiscus leptoporus TaxID=127549 RepID=A0A7S0J7R6_9EUKA|mmetsp:Transcript_42241/g.98948  ORF Transcript_42241/g.98948 Transcript_42241/m.98948 type:complete len:274 (+) Transcript_42241:215-1036(+)